MQHEELLAALKAWRLSPQKMGWLLLGIVALLVYEFPGRQWYRPWVKNNQVNDLHVADTLGNSFGTMVTICALLFVFGSDKKSCQAFVWIGTVAVGLFELMHPLLGKPIDKWDLLATLLTGLLMLAIVKVVYKKG